MFRFKKSIPVEYDQQGYIYFVSKQFDRLPVSQQKRIRRLCEEAGGEYARALFEFVTTDAGAMAVCGRHYLSESTLERIVRKYYIAFSKSV